ncbi:MAG TPA: pyridoxamine 5'-phosphate oxidase family protein [Nitrososphaeraceae archaeon]|jgi:nitroimidazol reductase NimA-like FMN-containing flavoprotein (pyridoxamine 5'-phosphate oxidase superfamily)
MVSEDMIVECLTNSKIPIRLACMSISDWPIVVSLWYTYLNEKVYCATQNTAKVVKYLRKNPKCGFEIAGDSFPYRGVRGYGKASIVENKGEEILRMLIQKYLTGKETTISSLKLYKLLLSKEHLQNEVAIEIIPSAMFKWDYKKRMKDS